jgi:hypothetical protein
MEMVVWEAYLAYLFAAVYIKCIMLCHDCSSASSHIWAQELLNGFWRNLVPAVCNKICSAYLIFIPMLEYTLILHEGEIEVYQIS